MLKLVPPQTHRAAAAQRASCAQTMPHNTVRRGVCEWRQIRTVAQSLVCRESKCETNSVWCLYSSSFHVSGQSHGAKEARRMFEK
jgi:hypothetical protein